MGLQPARGGASGIDSGRSAPDGSIRRGASLDYYGQSVDPKTREMGIGDQKAIREEENRQAAGGDERRRGRQETPHGQTSREWSIPRLAPLLALQ